MRDVMEGRKKVLSISDGTGFKKCLMVHPNSELAFLIILSGKENTTQATVRWSLPEMEELEVQMSGILSAMLIKKADLAEV